MSTLAEAADVAAELGLSNEFELTDVQANRIPGLLIKASGLFRRAAGNRQFDLDTYTHRVQVVGGRVRLPETPVTAVTMVVDDCGNAVAYTRVGDWLTVAGHHHNLNNSFGCYRPENQGSGWFVTVTYNGGGIPDDVRVTVAQAVARALGMDKTAQTGVKSHDQTLGPMSERKQFFDWAAEAVTLTDDECAFAESFRYPGTQLIMHRPSC